MYNLNVLNKGGIMKKLFLILLLLVSGCVEDTNDLKVSLPVPDPTATNRTPTVRLNVDPADPIISAHAPLTVSEDVSRSSSIITYTTDDINTHLYDMGLEVDKSFKDIVPINIDFPEAGDWLASFSLVHTYAGGNYDYGYSLQIKIQMAFNNVPFVNTFSSYAVSGFPNIVPPMLSVPFTLTGIVHVSAPGTQVFKIQSSNQATTDVSCNKISLMSYSLKKISNL